MAKSAINQLQDQIDAIRREAYAEGYAAAMQAIQKAAALPPSHAAVAPARRQPGTAKAAPEPTAMPPAPRRRGRLAKAMAGKPATGVRGARRPRRGTNAQLVAEVLQAVAPRAVRPAEIRAALQRDKGVDMAFTSIRHALGQLEARQAAEPGAENKTWRHRA
jgi:hypothetical protein